MTAIGVIGLGAVSGAHLRGYGEVEGVEVVAACDVDPGALATAPATARRYADWQELVAAPEVEAVAILLPHVLHHPVAVAALDAGRHVSIEKPMALDRGECMDLLQRAERAGVTLTVAENTRFVAAYAEAVRLLPSLGRIRLVRTFVHGSAIANYRRPDAGWRVREGGVGAIVDAACHSFYLLRWMLGPVDSLQASTRSWVRENLFPDMEVEDGAIITGRLSGGGHFSCEVSLSAELPWGERLELHGEHGTLVVDQLAPHPVRLYRGGEDLAGEAIPAVLRDPAGWQPDSIAAAARDFALAVRDRREPAVRAEDAAYAVELIDCAYRSAGAGGVAVTPSPT